MPEMSFHVRWPDGVESVCYSPSRIVAEYLRPATSYTVAEFLARSRGGLLAASERVRERYGSACGRALNQIEQIERRAGTFLGQPGAEVVVLRVEGAQP